MKKSTVEEILQRQYKEASIQFGSSNMFTIHKGDFYLCEDYLLLRVPETSGDIDHFIDYDSISQIVLE